MKKSTLPKRPIRKPVRKDSRKKPGKKKYKVRNWKEYNESLVRRGSIEFWIEKGIAEVYRERNTIIIRRKRGGQQQYADSLIELCRLVGKVFHRNTSHFRTRSKKELTLKERVEAL